MKRCHVCERPREPRDDYVVALRNGLYFPACFRCWFMWPDEHKLWPATGYGRSPAEEKRGHITLEDLIELVGPS